MVIDAESLRDCPVVLHADDFHCGGTQLILLRSDTLSNNEAPIAHNDPELQLCMVEISADKFDALVRADVFC